MLGDGGTGVATYARALLAAAPLTGAAVAVLAGGEADSRAGRWARAARPGARRGRLAGAGGGVGPDLFREAQVHFNLYRRLLPISLPGPPGVMHWTYPVPAQVEGWANVYTIHDAVPLDRPELSPIRTGRHRALLRTVAAGAAAVATVSEAARGDLLRHLPLPPELVLDCGEAVLVDGAGPPPPEVEPGRYLLFCGLVERRKNLSALLAAYRASGAGLPLVLAGPDGPGSGAIGREAARTPGVVRLPFQPRDRLLGLIAGARALLFPSLAEGFGLPVAEAMTLGTPVMTADAHALAETAGDAALLVDPADIDAMARAIGRLAADAALCADLSARGLRRAARWTVPAFAERLRPLYDLAIDRTHPRP